MIHRFTWPDWPKQDIYPSARALLAQGCSPEDRLELYRGGMLCMQGLLGELAKWSVSETDRAGLRRIKWQPNPLFAKEASA